MAQDRQMGAEEGRMAVGSPDQPRLHMTVLDRDTLLYQVMQLKAYAEMPDDKAAGDIFFTQPVVDGCLPHSPFKDMSNERRQPIGSCFAVLDNVAQTSTEQKHSAQPKQCRLFSIIRAAFSQQGLVVTSLRLLS